MISIIIPIYNASKYLDACLHSIYIQDYADYEVLCIDDGSIDNSADIVRKYVDFDNRFILFQQTNSGVSVARNLGLKHACGEYVCFIDADDMVASNFLSVLYNLCQDGSFTICSYTKNTEDLGTPSSVIKKYNKTVAITKIVDEKIQHPNLWAMMFKSEIIKSFNIEFYPGCVRNEDTEFYMKYLVHETGDIVITDYKGYFYRDNPNSAMHNTKRNAFTSFEASARIENYLLDNGIKMNYNKMLYSSVQAYSVNLARERNQELYDELHNMYNIDQIMRALTTHPRLLRRIVAYVYLILGKRLFYYFFSMISK